MEGYRSPETTGAATGPRSQSIFFFVGANWNSGIMTERTISRKKNRYNQQGKGESRGDKHTDFHHGELEPTVAREYQQ